MKLKYLDKLKQNLAKYYLIYVLVVLIIIFLLFIIRGVLVIQRQKIIGQHKTVTEFLLSHETSIKDVDFIENWMTFRYINTIFKIPDEYLKTKLNIDNKKYPNMSVKRFSKDKKIDTTTGLNQVKSVLKEYIVNKPSTK